MQHVCLYGRQSTLTDIHLNEHALTLTTFNKAKQKKKKINKTEKETSKTNIYKTIEPPSQKHIQMCADKQTYT